jgi:hypothetical protein
VPRAESFHLAFRDILIRLGIVCLGHGCAGTVWECARLNIVCRGWTEEAAEASNYYALLRGTPGFCSGSREGEDPVACVR